MKVFSLLPVAEATTSASRVSFSVSNSSVIHSLAVELKMTRVHAMDDKNDNAAILCHVTL